jgi:predicted transcriptional regulator
MHYEISETDAWYLEAWEMLEQHHRRAPSVRELAAYIDRAPSTVHEALLRIEAAGALVREQNGSLVRPRHARKHAARATR